ncbi:hypothetical protein [Demequina sp. NBRC 110057]|uniref:hypothetical protein n=1 Tax=Demequina sp. NBRC 110057 TaxID=1570346 RepID=UPI0009FE1E89|nr:hypothetical protein [Demequina sp. NBRC 110057]
MRPLASLAVAGLALALAACSGGDTPDDAVSGAAENASASASADPTDGGGTAAGDASSDAAGTDPYCDAAQQGYLAQVDLLEASDRSSVQTSAEDGAGSVELANAAGAAMVEAIDAIDDTWGAARDRLASSSWVGGDDSVSDEQAAAAFEDFLDYVDALARPEAELLASMETLADYQEGMAALMDEPGVSDSAQAGAAAVSTIVSYTVARCGDLPES